MIALHFQKGKRVYHKIKNRQRVEFNLLPKKELKQKKSKTQPCKTVITDNLMVVS